MNHLSLLLLLAGISVSAIAQPVIKRSIYFDTDKAYLREESLRTLEKLADTLKDFKSFELLIVGNTDAVGDSLYNIGLSQKRTEAVYYFFRAKKMCGCKLKTDAVGENKPVADNSTEDGKQRNRRVDVYVSIPGKKIAGKP
jgi:OmpA-OmpF porin, OOP family